MEARRTSNADKLLRSRCDELLLEETSTTTLDAVQLIIHLVSTVEGYVEHNILRQRVEAHWHETSLLNDLPTLETSGYLGNDISANVNTPDVMSRANEQRRCSVHPHAGGRPAWP